MWRPEEVTRHHRQTKLNSTFHQTLNSAWHRFVSLSKGTNLPITAQLGQPVHKIQPEHRHLLPVDFEIIFFCWAYECLVIYYTQGKPSVCVYINIIIIIMCAKGDAKQLCVDLLPFKIHSL